MSETVHENQEKPLTYQQRYYLDNKKKIQRAKKRRYNTNTAYRNAAIKRASEWYREHAELVKERSRQRRSARDPHILTMKVEGKTLRMEVLHVGDVAKALGRSVKTIYAWERKGVIPKDVHRSAAHWRLYTRDQCDAIVTAFREAKIERAVKGNPRIKVFQDILAQKWAQMPEGVVVRGAVEDSASQTG